MKKLITLLLVFNLHFSAQAQEVPLLRFGVFTDCQYAQKENHAARRYDLSPEKLDRAIDFFNEQRVEFIVSLGDLIDRDFQSYTALKPHTDRADSSIFYVLGNHDFLRDSAQWHQALEQMNLDTPYYYTIRRHGVCLVILNSNEDSTYATQPGTASHRQAQRTLDSLKQRGALNARAMNGAVGSKQLAWLETELRRAQRDNEIVIVLSHHPLYYPINVVSMLNYSEVRNVLEAYPVVKAHLSGHYHLGGYGRLSSIHYLILLAMVETGGDRYALVEVYRDKILIKGQGDQPDMTMKF